MATVIREVNPSRPVDNQSGRLTSTREFVVYDDATPANISRPEHVINLFGVTAGEAMPTFGDVYPNIPELMAVDYSNLRQEEGNPYLWRITWNYMRSTGAPPGPNPGEPGYWEYSYSATCETEDAWRMASEQKPLWFPAGGEITGVFGPVTDIRGVSIDSGGDPGSTLRMVQNLDITEVVAGQYTPAASFTFLKKRNNNTFLGAQKGRLVYAGIMASMRIDVGIFSIRHRLVWDEWFHLRQRPRRLPSGEPSRYVDPDDPDAVGWVADAVYWYQPFPTLANFDAISSQWP